MGLLTCPMFASSALRIEGPMIVRVAKYMCPTHDFRGVYDRNLVKMVEERKTGGSWFDPPDMTPEPRKKELEKKKKVQRNDDIKLCVTM
ncbi:hypothetical protein BELL_0127g00080 [Botrytis elliptica]|uniref:Uncharacterized protein n=1 Tax=Botrytis elliptica TaxID=278938 RepID=A0A4Z1K6P3_9HELO|nr:hypothetical protein BELL_0127g00080 [Botrytis elliptica]